MLCKDHLPEGGANDARKRGPAAVAAAVAAVVVCCLLLLLLGSPQLSRGCPFVGSQRIAMHSCSRSRLHGEVDVFGF